MGYENHAQDNPQTRRRREGTSLQRYCAISVRKGLLVKSLLWFCGGQGSSMHCTFREAHANIIFKHLHQFDDKCAAKSHNTTKNGIPLPCVHCMCWALSATIWFCSSLKHLFDTFSDNWLQSCCTLFSRLDYQVFTYVWMHASMYVLYVCSVFFLIGEKYKTIVEWS